MNWKEYENRVLEYFKTRFPEALITKNAQLPGKLSGTFRDIDILVESQVFGHALQIAIECKNWNSKLDVADVGSFIDKLNDVGITKGVIISKLGYSDSAHQRALKDMLCFIHPFEYSATEAQKKRQFMYFQIYPILEGHNLEKSFHAQDLIIKQKYSTAEIEYWDERTAGGKVTYRKIQSATQGYAEFTAGVETNDFFVYCVYTVPIEFLPDDLARLRYVMAKLRLIKLSGVDPTDSHKSWQGLFDKIKNKGTSS
jgi:Restriction endonuclease.